MTYNANNFNGMEMESGLRQRSVQNNNNQNENQNQTQKKANAKKRNSMICSIEELIEAGVDISDLVDGKKAGVNTPAQMSKENFELKKVFFGLLSANVLLIIFFLVHEVFIGTHVHTHQMHEHFAHDEVKSTSTKAQITRERVPSVAKHAMALRLRHKTSKLHASRKGATGEDLEKRENHHVEALEKHLEKKGVVAKRHHKHKHHHHKKAHKHHHKKAHKEESTSTSGDMLKKEHHAKAEADIHEHERILEDEVSILGAAVMLLLMYIVYNRSSGKEYTKQLTVVARRLSVTQLV
jgi:uncharacterized membrane protein